MSRLITLSTEAVDFYIISDQQNSKEYFTPYLEK